MKTPYFFKPSLSSAGIWLLLLFLSAGLSGCALWGKKEPERSAQGMYEEAVRLLEKKKYERAAEAFRKFKEDYPLSTYTPLAELRTADALYLDKNYAEAIVHYEEFRKLHPVHAEVPHAIYHIGMSYYRQMLSVDRDQTATEKALEQFRYLSQSFPQSKYFSDAQTKMQLCQRQLADKEFYIGSFYYRQGHYLAAVGRFEEILRKYPDAGLEGKVNPLLEICRKKAAQEEKKRREKEEKEAKKKQPS